MVLPAVPTLLLFLVFSSPTASRIIYTPDAAQLECSPLTFASCVVFKIFFFLVQHLILLLLLFQLTENLISSPSHLIFLNTVRCVKKTVQALVVSRFTLFYSIAGRMTRHIWNYRWYEMLEAFTQTSPAMRKMQPYIGGWYWTKYKYNALSSDRFIVCIIL